MAEAAAFQAQAEVTERRLRPLYDALDYGHSKKALQIADKILKKQPDLNCAKVLKGLALLRLSKGDEANGIITKVLATHPGDQATLQALTLFYRETGDFQRITEMYADAAKHYPKSQDILTHLFMAYVRVGDVQKQQQIGAQLTKLFPKNGPYQCWRVMSILMQADDANNPQLTKSMYLPLADKLITKYFQEHSVEAEAEVRLYLMVLERLGAADRILTLLEGQHGQRIKDHADKEFTVITVLQALCRWKEAGQRLVALIEVTPDCWKATEAYIQGQLQWSLMLYRERPGKGDDHANQGADSPTNDSKNEDTPANQCEGGDCAANEGEVPANQSNEGEVPANQTTEGSVAWSQPLTEARELIERLVSRELAKFADGQLCVRGPLLARLELFKAVQQVKEPEISLPGSAYSHLMDYFKVFGTKSCVFDDLLNYLTPDALPADQVNRFIADISTLVEREPVEFDCPPDKVRENLSRMRRHISVLQLQRYRGNQQLKVPQKLELITTCLRYYHEGLKLGSEFRDTAHQPADFYVILAAHLKLELYQETGDACHAWETVFMLEGVKNHNNQAVLLLMKLYGHLGVAEAITDLYNTANIKHIQTETLGYLPGRYLQSTGTFGFANQLYRTAFRFFYSGSKEVAEYVIQCFKNGVFHKIPEMLVMRNRLAHSFNFASTMVDMSTLELLTSVNSYSEALTFFQKDWRKGMPYTTANLKEYCSALVDSRDLSVVDDWSPPPMRLSNVEIKITFDLECLWLRVRICLMKCALATMTCITGEEVVKDKKSTVALSEQIGELGTTLESLSQHVGVALLRERSKCQLHPVQSPPPCLGYVFQREGHGAVLSLMLTAVLDVLSGATTVREKLGNVLANLQAVKSRIKGVNSDLREALMRVASPTMRDNGDEGIVVTSPLDSEHPYDIITRSRLDLEEYVLFVQTVSYLALLCTLSAEFLAPAFSGGKKKKKKKATGKTPPTVSSVCTELVDFMKELILLVISTSQVFQPIPAPKGGEDELVKQLKELYLTHSPSAVTGATYLQSVDAGHPSVKVWKDTVTKACGVAVSSYNMSFRDTLEVVKAKIQALRDAIKQLGGTYN